MVTRGSAARGRTASESTARETGESSAHRIDKKHASIPRSRGDIQDMLAEQRKLTEQLFYERSVHSVPKSVPNFEMRETSYITYHR
jgi:hypothetical protein